MQEKMERFRLEPSPSDWQAIYDRLHPGKKRRMIWWLLPLVAALIGGALWYSNTQSFISDKEINSLAVANPKKETGKTPEPATTKTAIPIDKTTDSETVTTKTALPIDKSTNAEPATTKTSLPINKTSDTYPANTKTTLPINKTTNNKPTTPLPAIRTTRKNEPTTKGVPSSTNKKNTTRSGSSPEQNKTAAKSPKETIVEQSVIAEQATAISKPLAENNQAAKSDAGITAMSVDSNQALAQKVNTIDSTKNSPTVNTQISTKTKPRKWNLSVYVAAGPAFPTEPLSVFPQMMAADLSSSPVPGNNNQTYTNITEQNGWHFAGGIMAEKKMGKRWLFSAGLGINSSTWKTTIEKYQDSVVSGAFYSRVKLSTETYDYQLLMAELPLQFSNKISGKNAGSLWWTIGLNNQFTINLSQKATFNNPLTSSLSDKKSLNSSTRFYQPQLRLGLLYDHTKAVHWQVQPLLQYSMLPVYKNGSSDDMQLTNLQLQFNLFFQGSKHAAKAKK